MSQQPPPEATSATDDDLVSHLVGQVGAFISRGAPAAEHPHIIGGAIRAAIHAERARVVSILVASARGAEARSHVAAREGRKSAAAQLALTSQVAARLAQAVEKPPGADVCRTCRGQKVVPSQVVLAGGGRAAVPCPACAIAVAAAAAPAPEATLAPPSERPDPAPPARAGLALVPAEAPTGDG